MSLQIASLREEHLEDAAVLVSARYRALRQRLPILPSRYEQADTIVGLLRGIMGQTDGVVATCGGRLVGFMTGFVIAEWMGKRTAYSPEWANGADPGHSRRVYEEMYRHLSARWVADGCFLHAVTLPAHDRAGIEGWHWLGFGMVAVDGVRELTPVEGHEAEVELRRAGVEDVREVTPLIKALERHVAAPPTFFIHDLEEPEEWLGKPGHALWLAYEGGEPVGCMALEPGHVGGCEVVQDEETISIESAFIKEEARGRGAATALLNQCLAWARAEGYARCAVDFEAVNVLAVRFWTRWFEPVCYSLLRWIDERVAPASPVA